jgi:hypothetical protein
MGHVVALTRADATQRATCVSETPEGMERTGSVAVQFHEWAGSTAPRESVPTLAICCPSLLLKEICGLMSLSTFAVVRSLAYS